MRITLFALKTQKREDGVGRNTFTIFNTQKEAKDHDELFDDSDSHLLSFVLEIDADGNLEKPVHINHY